MARTGRRSSALAPIDYLAAVTANIMLIFSAKAHNVRLSRIGNIRVPRIARHFSIRGVYDRSIGMPNQETLKRTLRHTCGFKLANDGQDTPALRHYLGHRQFSTW